MNNPDGVDKVYRAIQEVVSKRDTLTDETITEVLLALYNRLQYIQTRRDHAPPPDDEIRLVTVMFVDVVGATRMAELLGDEAWRLLIREAHRHLADTVQRWDGEVGQYLGDGMLCYFGARRSLSNDAVRAVACALAMQERIAEYSFRVQDTHNLDSFAVRIGISTGRAVVGAFGDPDQMTTLAVGSTTNLAARLQALAPPGEIVIDNETYLRVRSDFTAIQQKAVELKGFEKPVPYYLVTGQRHQTPTQFATDRVANIPIPFIGRQRLYQHLLDEMHHIEAKHTTRAVTIYGDIGLGKSRLLQEIARSPTAERFFVVQMVGHYERSETAFSLLRDMLYTTCDLAHTLTEFAAEQRILQWTRNAWHSDADPDAAAAVIGYVAGYGFTGSPYTRALYQGPANRNNEAVHRAALTWLDGVAGSHPLLLLVDNLQWADDESINLLNALCTAQRGALLLATTRPDFGSPNYMKSNPNHTHFHLPPLTTENIHSLLDAILRYLDNVPPDLRTLISERAEGNPLFVEEFLRMLFDNNVLERNGDAERWTVNSFRYRTMESELPNGLLGMFQARLDDLPSAVRRVVQIASVVGQTFWEGAVSTLATEDTADRIRELVARGIVIEHSRSVFDNDTEYSFRNTLYHEVAYSMLPRTYRTSYHQEAAAWMASQPEIKPEVLGLLAGHYLNAEQPLDALRTYTEAAEHQLGRGQLTEAISMVESGLAAVRKVQVREDALPYVSRLWLVQARAAHSRHNYSEATAASTTALMLLNELPDDVMRGERVLASVTLGNAYTSLGSYYQAQEALNQAENYLTGNPSHEAWIQRAFGLLFWSRGNLSKAEIKTQEALTAAETSGEQREVAAALSMLGRVALDRGDFSSTLDYMEQVLAMNQESANILYQVADMHLIATTHRLLFDYAGAMAVLDEAARLADQINYDTAMLRANRGLTLIGQGEHEAGLALLRAADADNHLNTHDYYEVKLALIRGLVQAGHDDECLDVAETFIDKRLQAYSRILYGRGMLWLGMAQHHLNQPNAADTLRKALDSEIRYGGRDVWLCYYALSLALPDNAAEHHQSRAYEALNAIAASLYRRPELAEAVGDPARIAQAFGE